jgi:TonB-dependent SusC/RagA subfamily outer membrane receptor
MKKFRLLFVILFLLCISGLQPVSSQNIKGKLITIEFQDENLSSVLKRLERISGYKILFTYDDVSRFTVSGKVRKATIDNALKTILANKPLEYFIDGKFVNITVKSVKATQIRRFPRVSGNVVSNDDGLPVIGASVKIKGTPIGAITDDKGHFELQNIPDNSLLEVSYLGMETETLVAQTKMNIRLKSNSQNLDEVVVTGIFNRRAASFTGSATSYNKEDLKMVGNQNVLKSLSNLDPAFIIDDNYSNGSNPNAFNNISIRGNASFTGLQSEYDGNPNEPLFIVDGFEATRQQVFDLDMNRVSSVTILKDAAAKAIYGSKAANGVVVIETIEPAKGRLRLTYTGDLNVEAPDLTSYDLCNSAEKLQVEYNSGRYSATSPSFNQALMEQYNDLKALRS